jgi:hypothetical protein
MEQDEWQAIEAAVDETLGYCNAISICAATADSISPADPRPYCALLVNKHPTQALADFGATLSLLDTQFAAKLGCPITPCSGKLNLALAGHTVDITGYVLTDIKTTSHHLRSCKLYIAPLPDKTHIYLGMDLLPRLGIKITGLPIDFPNAGDPFQKGPQI